MAITAGVETALIDDVRKLFGQALRTVDSLPGAWSEDTIKRLVVQSPAVYVAWIGARRDKRPRTCVNTWALFVVANMLNGQRQNAIGAYQISDRLIGWLDGRFLEPANGAFEFTQAANLYSDSQSKNGVIIYGLYFDVLQPMPEEVDVNSLDEFKTYYHQWPIDDTLKMESMNKIRS